MVGGIIILLLVWLFVWCNGIDIFWLIIIGIGVCVMLVVFNIWLLLKVFLEMVLIVGLWNVGLFNGLMWVKILFFVFIIILMFIVVVLLVWWMCLLEMGDDIVCVLGVSVECLCLLMMLVVVVFIVVVIVFVGLIFFIVLVVLYIVWCISGIVCWGLIQVVLCGVLLLLVVDFCV